MEMDYRCGMRRLLNLSLTKSTPTLSFTKCGLTSSKGITLPELLATMSVISILGFGVVPGMTEMVQENRLSTAANELIAHLHLTRSEAVKTGTRVIMCPSLDGKSCEKSSEWHSGWMVFQELNQNNQPDADERVIRVHEGIAGITIRSGISRQRVKYSPLGNSYGSNTTFVFCDEHGDSNARAVILSPSGRPRSSDSGPGNKPLNCT